MKAQFATAAGAMMLAFAFVMPGAQAQEVMQKQRVGTALVLCVDSSGSIDRREYRLQYDGTAFGFESDNVASKVAQSGIAVKIIEFDTIALARTDWIVMRNLQELQRFIALLRGMRRVVDGGTHIDACTNAGIVAHADLEKRGVFALNQVIDVSGDEFSGSGPGAIKKAQELAESLAIRVNGLPITDPAPIAQLGANTTLVTGYDFYVRTNTGFIEIAKGFDDYARAMRKKLDAEIAWNWGTQLAGVRPRP